MTATRKKIDALRTDLAKLEWEHKLQKICEAASQGLLGNNDSGDSSSIPSFRKRGSRVSLSRCANILCFMQAYGILVCKQHHNAIVNLDKHLSRYHNAGCRNTFGLDKLRREMQYKNITKFDKVTKVRSIIP